MKYRLSTLVSLLLVTGIVLGINCFFFPNSPAKNWKDNPGDSVDGLIGELTSSETSLVIKYDIGPFAGEYASLSMENRQKHKWVRKETRHQSTFVCMLKNNDTLCVTFSDEGPANYWVKINEQNDIELILDLLARYRHDLLISRGQ